MLAIITVTSNLDDDGNNLTLREAIVQANINPDLDTIQFDPTVFSTLKTITLTQGDLSISKAVTIDGTIDGAGPSEVSLGITIDASGSDLTPNSTPLDGNTSDDGDGTNVFSISAQADNTAITLADLTITGGDTAFSVGGRKGDILIFQKTGMSPFLP